MDNYKIWIDEIMTEIESQNVHFGLYYTENDNKTDAIEMIYLKKDKDGWYSLLENELNLRKPKQLFIDLLDHQFICIEYCIECEFRKFNDYFNEPLSCTIIHDALFHN